MRENDQKRREPIFLEMTREAFLEFEKLPLEVPIQMVNLLKFRVQISGSVGGASKYEAYLKAAKPFFSKSDMKILFFGSVQKTMIGPEEEWDKILIVEYASKADFLNAVRRKGYPSEMRLAALADSRLFCCTKT